MGSLVKLASPTRLKQSLNLELAPGLEVVHVPSYLGLEIRGTPTEGLYYNSGDMKGKLVQGTEVDAKKRYIVDLGTVEPFKYQALVEINPQLYPIANVQCARILEPGEPIDLQYTLQPVTGFDLTILDWHVRIYLLD